MYPIQKIPSRIVLIDQTEYLWFGGTSYLGISHDPTFQELVQKGIEKHGANWGSSRNNPLQIAVYEEVESYLSDFVNAPSALTVSSGMLAGQIVLNYFQNKYKNAHKIFAPRVHPALWPTDYQANKESFDQFVNTINKEIIEQNASEVVIMADSVSSPHFEKYNFDWVKNLPQNMPICLIIDDSHSLGIMGENGAGVYNTIKKNDNVQLIVVASLNKALGVPAGVIIGQNSILNEIRNTAFFSACSPMSPAYAYACANAKEIYKLKLLQLKSNIDYFKTNIDGLTRIENLEGHPAFCINEATIFEYLFENGIFIPSFAYPNPTDKPISRLVISNLHSKIDLDILSEKLNEFFNKLT
jgi:8-amino-7-oxononanoate synthase